MKAEIMHKAGHINWHLSFLINSELSEILNKEEPLSKLENSYGGFTERQHQFLSQHHLGQRFQYQQSSLWADITL